MARLLPVLLTLFLCACTSQPPIESTGAWTPAKSEIRAAGSLDFDSNRTGLLRGLAVRPTLSPEEQVYLVCIALDRLTFESNRVAVLCDLINNSAFSVQARQAILDRIRGLEFESNRVLILNSLAHRFPPATAPA